MIRETKDFFSQPWQKLLFVTVLNLIITVGSNFSLNKYLMEQATRKNEQQDQSIFELQLNQTHIAAEEKITLPYKLTVTRSGS